MHIKITADSTCDLSAELLQKHDITIIPLTVIKDDQAYLDGITITPADIFAHVDAGGALCSTSAVSVGEYIDQFNKFAPHYDCVVHINIGSGFSACYQNACLAAEEFDNVIVVDSHNLTTGQGLVALKACALAESVSSPAQLKQQLEDYTKKIEASFLVEKLDYLVKGGRCSSAAALGANLLNLKPCIEVADGKMAVGKKYRGNFSKCLTSYIKERLEGREDIDPSVIFITRAVISDDIRQAVLDAIHTYGHFETVVETATSCTVSCHCGPSTLGIIFARK